MNTLPNPDFGELVLLFVVDLSGESFKVLFLAHTNLERGVQEATNHNAAAPSYSNVTRPKIVA